MHTNINATQAAHYQNAAQIYPKKAAPSDTPESPPKSDQAEISPEARRTIMLTTGLASAMDNKALSLGRSIAMEVDGQTFRVKVNDEGIWISQNEDWLAKDDFQLVDPSTGVPGIPRSTVLAIEYNIMLRQNMPLSISISPESGEGVLGLHAHMQQMVSAFETVSNSSNGQHSSFIEQAFAEMVRNHFGAAAQTSHLRLIRETASDPSIFMSPPDADVMNELRLAGQARADNFLNFFFQNVTSQGAEAAFNTTWALLD